MRSIIYAAVLVAGALLPLRAQQPAPKAPAHFRFTPEQIRKEMADAGYALEAEHDFLPRQHFLVFR